MKVTTRILPAALSILAFGVTAWGQDKWLLTTAQFKTEAIVVKSLDASGLKVVAENSAEETTVPMADFLDISRTLAPAKAEGKLILHMAGGDQLAGEPVKLKADSLVWNSPELGEIEIPGSRLLGITPPGKPAPADHQHEDFVHLSNGDAVHGIIASMSSDKITVQTAAGNSDVPMSAVASISFASTPGSGHAARGFRVRFEDGSSLVGSEVRLDGDKLILTLSRNVERQVALSHVVAIEQVNGPVSWLSSRPPLEAVYYRLMGSSLEPAYFVDRAWNSPHGAIEFKGRPFAHGLAVHAYSRMTWNLDGTFAAFRTRYAIEGDGGVADATIRIRLDDKVVYEQSHVRSGVLSPVVIQDLGAAKRLTLEVDGGTAYSQDAVDWIEPALLKEKPTDSALLDGGDAAAPATTQPATKPAEAR